MLDVGLSATEASTPQVVDCVEEGEGGVDVEAKRLHHKMGGDGVGGGGGQFLSSRVCVGTGETSF